MSRALWWVTNGRAVAPPWMLCSTGPSTSVKPAFGEVLADGPDGGVPDAEDLAGCARWPPGRGSAAGSGSRRRSARGACPAARPAPCPAGRPTPRRPTARPGGWSSPCPRRRPSRRGPARRTPGARRPRPRRRRRTAGSSPSGRAGWRRSRPPWWRSRASRPATRTRSVVRVSGGEVRVLVADLLQRVVGRDSGRAGRGRRARELVQAAQPVLALRRGDGPPGRRPVRRTAPPTASLPARPDAGAMGGVAERRQADGGDDGGDDQRACAVPQRVQDDRADERADEPEDLPRAAGPGRGVQGGGGDAGPRHVPGGAEEAAQQQDVDGVGDAPLARESGW